MILVAALARAMQHYACESGRVAAARLLIDAGANINRRNKKGRTPADAAHAAGQPATKALLDAELDIRQAEADMHFSDLLKAEQSTSEKACTAFDLCMLVGRGTVLQAHVGVQVHQPV